MVSFKREIEPYIVAVDEHERTAYQRLRVPSARPEPAEGLRQAQPEPSF
jgi:hypothetical protein